MFPENDWAVYCRHAGDTMPEVSFKLVDIICTLTSAASMLAIEGVHSEATRTDAKNKRVLVGWS